MSRSIPLAAAFLTCRLDQLNRSEIVDFTGPIVSVLDGDTIMVADVVSPDGTNVSRELLRAGLGWWYRQYSKEKSLGALEQEARQAKRGLWADLNPIPPWEIRHPKQGRTPSAPGSLSSEPGEKPATTPMAIIAN